MAVTPSYHDEDAMEQNLKESKVHLIALQNYHRVLKEQITILYVNICKQPVNLPLMFCFPTFATVFAYVFFTITTYVCVFVRHVLSTRFSCLHHNYNFIRAQ